MANKKGIGYSPLTDKVYLGTQNVEKRMWVGDKTDITNEFLAVSNEFFEEGTMREVTRSDGKVNLFININISNDRKSINKLIQKLNKLAEDGGRE